MSDLIKIPTFSPVTTDFRRRIEEFEAFCRTLPQIEPVMEHLLHAGMYFRTAHVEANQVFTNVLVKIPTVLIVSGVAAVNVNGRWHWLRGYNVLAAAAYRKSIYLTQTATSFTMAFLSHAKTVEEAEREFTDESDQLLSRHHRERDLVMVTGVTCQA
jgi:hypothetical protein